MLGWLSVQRLMRMGNQKMDFLWEEHEAQEDWGETSHSPSLCLSFPCVQGTKCHLLTGLLCSLHAPGTGPSPSRWKGFMSGRGYGRWSETNQSWDRKSVQRNHRKTEKTLTLRNAWTLRIKTKAHRLPEKGGDPQSRGK